MARTGIAVSAPPEVIGPYRIVRELGRGGMGQVFEAVHGVLDKRVAIKILRPHLAEDAVSVQRFLREGRAACHVDHPNVVDVHELGSDGDMPYLVMELLDGEHLGARLRRSPPLRLDELVEILLPVVSAVSAAHAAGIVHRDLKPSNIMLSVSRGGDSVPKVLDFGTSKLRGDERDPFLTITGAVLGTLHYMSPEQTLAPQNADAKSDQYSLGVMLYECATGQKPFVGHGGYELMHAIMTAPVAAPSSLNAALPVELDSVVLRAMNRAPRHRYPSVREFGAALLPFAPEYVADAYRAEFTASSTPSGNGAAVDAGWEKGTEAEVDPARSNGTFIDPATAVRGRKWRRPLGALAISALAVTAGVTFSAAPRRAVESRASAGDRPGESRVTHPAAHVVAASSVIAPAMPPAEQPPAAPEIAKSASVSQSPHGGTAAAHTQKRPRTASQPAESSTHPGRPVLLGDNGAPILE